MRSVIAFFFLCSTVAAQYGESLGNVGQQLDTDISQIQQQLNDLDRRVSALEDEPPPPIGDRDGDGVPDNVDRCPDVAGPAHNDGCPVDNELPPALKTVEVDNWRDLRDEMRAAKPGTHVVLTKSLELDSAISVRWSGTPENPVVLRGANSNIKIEPSQSWSHGRHTALLSSRGSDIWFYQLHFDGGAIDGGGRLLSINSSKSGISERVTVYRCRLDRSWNTACVAQGHSITFLECSGTDNCRRNKDGTVGSWPYVIGSWPIWDKNDRPTIFCTNIRFIRCEFKNNYGEGLCINYSRGGAFIDCVVENARYIALYANTSDNLIVTGNRISNPNPVEGKGNDCRAIEIGPETFGSLPTIGGPVAPVLLENNVVEGKNIRHALRFKNHRGKETYHSWTLRNNDWSTDTIREPVYLEKAEGGKPHSCTTDTPLVGFVGDPDAWTVIGGVRLLKSPVSTQHDNQMEPEFFTAG